MPSLVTQFNIKQLIFGCYRREMAGQLQYQLMIVLSCYRLVPIIPSLFDKQLANSLKPDLERLIYKECNPPCLAALQENKRISCRETQCLSSYSSYCLYVCYNKHVAYEIIIFTNFHWQYDINIKATCNVCFLSLCTKLYNWTFKT